MTESSWIALVVVVLTAVIGPLILDIRKARREASQAAREAEERRDATRQAAAELAATAHREALDAKDREIAYWRDLALACLLPRGERLPSGREARQ